MSAGLQQDPALRCRDRNDNSFQAPGSLEQPPSRRRDYFTRPGPCFAPHRLSVVQCGWAPQNPGVGGRWEWVRALSWNFSHHGDCGSPRWARVGEKHLGGVGLKTSTIFKSLSPLPTPPSAFCGDSCLCWEKYLNLPLNLLLLKFCLGLLPSPPPSSHPHSPPHPLPTKGAMGEATGPTAEPPALFFLPPLVKFPSELGLPFLVSTF